MYLGLVIAALVFYYPATPHSSLQKLQNSIKSLGKSDADLGEELGYTRAELAAYQEAIVAITANFEHEVANAPICPTTGRRAITTITEDPRDELRSKCAALKEKIRLLEEQIKG